MIDHISLRVSDLEKSKKFYIAILKPVGYALESEYPDACGFRGEDGTSVWLIKENYVTKGVHVAFLGKDLKAVHFFHALGLSTGGIDNGAPGPRKEYREDYFGAFLLDFDDNNIEAVYYSDKHS